MTYLHRIKKKTSLLAIMLMTGVSLQAQHSYYWQQRADYKMDIDFDVKQHQYTGTQSISYTNNAPDTLYNLYWYLFYNAFQPGSEMDVRSKSIVDPDPRVGSRIAALKSDEIGYQKIKSLTIDKVKHIGVTEGTIYEVKLQKPIMPGQTVVIETAFEAQVPLQIRRAGRDNAEGVSYSMAQWFPKLCEYDKFGWHAHPYLGREFHGIWGNYDVKIEIDKDFVVAATGELQNPEEIGYGYTDKDVKRKGKKLTYHFIANKVIDFMWAADPDYKQIVKKAYNGTTMRFFYQPGEKTNENWEKLPDIMDKALKFMNENYGVYPYPVYNFIQGGDGGMEYPMGTLITGERSLMSLVGVSVHELMHSWYQMMLATNEAMYSWMDEGFTSFGSAETMNHLKAKGALPGEAVANPFERSVTGFEQFATSGVEEPLSTHSDHYLTNAAYGTGSYTKGALTLVQLSYILGEDVMKQGLLRYFNEWKFKHPTPDDFFRVMEKVSQTELDWFKEYWVTTTKTIDYSLDTLEGNKLHISRKGHFPMPLDIVITTKDNKEHLYYIPLVLMRNEKPIEKKYDSFKIAKDWPWAETSYKLQINQTLSEIKSIKIDPSMRMLDVDRSNNTISYE